MSTTQKSKGAGTVFLVVVALLAIAGGSAWLIHTVLNGGEIPFIGKRPSPTQQTGEPAPGSGATPAPGSEPGSPGSPGTPGSPGPGTLAPLPPATGPGGTPQPGSDAGTGANTLPGGVVVESLPGSAPDAPDTPTPGQNDGQLDGQDSVAAQPPQAAHPSQLTEPGEPTGQGDSGEQLLVVPGSAAAPAPSAREDAVVRTAFVDDIAAFLAQNYWPKGTHPSAKTGGITTASLRWANLRYGAELRSLDGRRGDAGQARQAVLHYVLNPATVGKLYGLYADPFVESLAREADARSVGEGAAKRLLTADEKKELFTIYSRYAARVAGALGKYAAAPGMAAKVESYAESETLVEEANKAYLESVIAYENSVEGTDKTAATAALLKRDKDAATYQKRIREREAAYNDLVAAMSPDGKVRASGNDTLVYVAFWSYRRGADSAPALRASAKALTDISAKLAAAAKGI